MIFAIRGLIFSISLGKQDVTKTIQDTLRLMKFWFKHGSIQEIDNLVRDGFTTKIDIKVWTSLIPQLLARIDIKNEKTKNSMLELLGKIGETYPQSLIYP